MTLIAIIWTIILLEIAALHLLWAARIWVPIREEEALARAVVGSAGITRMPGMVPCAAVALALAVAASLPWWDVFGLRRAALLAMALVFLARGAATYIPAIARLCPEEPFRSLNRKAYGPLCLMLGILAALLATVA